MKAVVSHAIGDFRVVDVPEPRLEQSTDAIVRLTTSAICGTDPQFVRATMSGMKPATILGHEGVGVVESVGPLVRDFKPGDRVIIPSTVGCGSCSHCREGCFAQCDNANPGGQRTGTAFFRSREMAGGFPGPQAEMARVPRAHVNLVKLPDEIIDEQAILLSDIVPTGWFAADIADIEQGHSVAVFGCGPVGQFAIASAIIMGARVIAVDHREDRLEMARRQGAETVNFDKEDPVKSILALTGDIGVDRAIDAVGVDTEHAHHGPAGEQATQQKGKMARQQQQVTPEAKQNGKQWSAGDASAQIIEWAVQALRNAGQLAIGGICPPSGTVCALGMAMTKNLTIKMGNCNHRCYYATLIDLVLSGALDPVAILTSAEPMQNGIHTHEAFDNRGPGWIAVALNPMSHAAE